MDNDRAKAFLSTMVDTLNAGALSLMISVGHRTALFDTMAGTGWQSSAELAEKAGLDERYVREWLAAMASGGVVDYRADDERFLLPEEHQTLLTRAGGSLNFAATMQTIGQLGSVEDDIVEAFTTGQGVPYERYGSFQTWMAELSTARFDAILCTGIIPTIPGAVDALTAGATLADVGCGSGHAVLLLAEAFPASTFVGIDFSEEALATAQQRANELGLTNVEFICTDAASLDIEDRFDFITTFDAIHDQAHPDVVLANIERALVPGGRYLCAEPKAHSHLADNMTEPGATFQYTMSTMHCMSVSIAGGGEGLGTAWGTERAVAAIEAAGFANITTAEIKGDRTNTYFLSRKPG